MNRAILIFLASLLLFGQNAFSIYRSQRTVRVIDLETMQEHGVGIDDIKLHASDDIETEYVTLGFSSVEFRFFDDPSGVKRSFSNLQEYKAHQLYQLMTEDSGYQAMTFYVAVNRVSKKVGAPAGGEPNVIYYSVSKSRIELGNGQSIFLTSELDRNFERVVEALHSCGQALVGYFAKKIGL